MITTSNDVPTPAQRATQTLELLKKELPKCFDSAGRKRPLKLGIDIDLIEYFQADPRVSQNDLNLALYFYTRGIHYLEALIEGSDRIDLNGHPTGHVSNNEAEYAKLLLKRRAERAAKETERRAREELEEQREFINLISGRGSSFSRAGIQDL